MGNSVVKQQPAAESLTPGQSLILIAFVVIIILYRFQQQDAVNYRITNHDNNYQYAFQRQDAVYHRTTIHDNNYQNRVLRGTNRNVNYENNIRPLQKGHLLTKEPPIIPGNIFFIINNIWSNTKFFNWESYNYNAEPVHFVTLKPNSSEYQNVQHLFLRGTTKFQISSIERIQNVYVLAAFLLKKEEMKQRYPSTPPVVEELFHGTKKQNVMSICTENFDWRLFGENKGNKFGKGVSFTPISHYATYYGDEDSVLKVMFLVKVLIGKECVGSKYMKLPPPGYDTTTSENRQVIVKYEDNEFYPAYKIRYYCTSREELEKRKLKKHENRRYTPKPLI